MREIKFRAWDLDNDGMWYSDREEESGEGPTIWHICSDGIWFEENTLIDRLVGGEHEQIMEYRRPRQELMQYTGLKDKNEKEIYDGDILKASNRPQPYVVDWINCMAAWFPFCKEEITMNGFEVEVMGNIHENPELLNPVKSEQ